MLGLLQRYGMRTAARLNAFTLPGDWTTRRGRRAIPLPLDLGLHAPPGARLHGWIDRGSGWRPVITEPVPYRLDGPGWLGDAEIRIPDFGPGPLRQGWNRIRLGSWVPQAERAPVILSRPSRPSSRPLVSLLIPTEGRIVAGLHGPEDRVSATYRSVTTRTTYSNLEILVAHDGVIPAGVPGFEHRAEGPSTPASKWNALIERAKGSYLVLLDEGSEVLEPDWIQIMLEFAERPQTGVTGARMQTPDGRLRNAGLVFGLGALVGGVFEGHPHDCPFASRTRRTSAVSIGGLMFRRGFRLDGRFPGLLDADLCLQARERDLEVVHAADARLLHPGPDFTDPPSRPAIRELLRFRHRWPDCLPDPFYVADFPACFH